MTLLLFLGTIVTFLAILFGLGVLLMTKKKYTLRQKIRGGFEETYSVKDLFVYHGGPGQFVFLLV